MFGPATNKKGKGNSSGSDSDWDTTVDVPPPGHGADHDNTDVSDDDQDFPIQPTPRTRSSLTDKGKEDRGGDGAPFTARGQKASGPSLSAPSKRQIPASASAIHLSPFDSGSRSPSPGPPFTQGFQATMAKTDDKKKKKKKDSPGLSGRGLRDQRYEISPTPRIPASMEVALPRWDDSEAEQQTLRDLQANLKKEKMPENGGKAPTSQIQGGGDNNLSMEQASQSDNLRQPKELNALTDTAVMKTGERTTGGPEGKTFADCDTYQPFIVKSPDGKRFIYHFSEGSMSFYEVVEEESPAVLPKVADRVEGYVKRCWQEVFSVLRMVTSVLVLLVVEAVTFLTDRVARPLTLGVLVTTGNGLVKPMLAAVFNLLLQPALIFLWNVMSGMRHLAQPLVQLLGAFMTQLAVPLRAFRLVEVNNYNNNGLGHHCGGGSAVGGSGGGGGYLPLPSNRGRMMSGEEVV